MITNLPTVSVETEMFACQGGWDLATPPLSMKAGAVRDALNFMAGVEGGYQRIHGYERFDGHDSPSDALYYTVPATITGAWAVGNTLSGATSGATGKIVGSGTAGFCIIGLSGNFTTGEDLTISAAVVATCGGTQYANGADSRKDDASFIAAAADLARLSISAVPGGGPVRGVWEHNGVVYAFRNNAGATACLMYKATASGWSAVPGIPALAPNGKYRFANHNFGGATGTYCMYGASGTHKAFQFDGTTWTWITTGMTVDTPSFLTVHRNHLFLAFGSSVQHSPVANPTGTWTPVFGAAEIALGAVCTGFVPAIGNQDTAALMISTRNKIYVLYGNSSADWKLVSMAGEGGALPDTTQKIGDIVMLDDRGVTTMTTTSNYGNFLAGTISEKIISWIRENRQRASASCISRENNQYRLFMNNKYALFITMRGANRPNEIMPIMFNHKVECVCSAEMPDGSEAIYFGSDDGYVYQMDRGSSFDGEAIDYSLTMAFNHSKSPRVVKRYRRGALELQGSTYAEFNVGYQLDYLSPGSPQPGNVTVRASDLSAPLWDSFVWDAFFWDGRSIVPIEFSMQGSAENFALTVYGSSAEYYPFTISSVVSHYTPRRRKR